MKINKSMDKPFDQLMASFEKRKASIEKLRARENKMTKSLNDYRNNMLSKEMELKSSYYTFLVSQLELRGVTYSLKDIIKACVYVQKHFGDEIPDEAFVIQEDVIVSDASPARSMKNDG